MENDTRVKKLIILMGFLVFFSVITVMTSIYHKRVMKGRLQKLFSSVIINQVKDGVPIDSIKINLEKLKDIDSTQFTDDVKIMDFIIKDYRRVSTENNIPDSLSKK